VEPGQLFLDAKLASLEPAQSELVGAGVLGHAIDGGVEVAVLELEHGKPLLQAHPRGIADAAAQDVVAGQDGRSISRRTPRGAPV